MFFPVVRGNQDVVLIVADEIQLPGEVVLSPLQYLNCIHQPHWYAYELKHAEGRSDGDQNLVESALQVDDREYRTRSRSPIMRKGDRFGRVMEFSYR